MLNEEKFQYSAPVLDFIRVSAEYCKQIEQCQRMSAVEFCRIMRGLLPMIYLKMTLLGLVPHEEGWIDSKLTEEDYDYVRGAVADVMASDDDFLDVFVEDFKYSETPILCTVSENLADIYQQLRELVEVFRDGDDDAMNIALSVVAEEFELQWGQKLLNALRAIHDVIARQTN